MKISLVRPQPKARASNLRGRRRHPQRKPRSISRLQVCQPMAPALPVGNFGTFPFRGQLSGKPLPASTSVTVVSKSKHKGAWKTQFALEVAVVVISSPNAMRVYRSPLAECVPPAQSHVGVKRDDESSDQATAKALRFPACTIVSPRMSVIRATTGWKEARPRSKVGEYNRHHRGSQHNDSHLNCAINSRCTIVLCSRYHRCRGTGGPRLCPRAAQKNGDVPKSPLS